PARCPRPICASTAPARTSPSPTWDPPMVQRSCGRTVHERAWCPTPPRCCLPGVRGHRRSHPGRGADAMIDRPLSDPDLQGTIRVISAAATHVGHVRATNEDSVLNAPPIYLVADGMGGHNAGEVASAIAVEEFEKLTIQENVTVEQLGEALRTAAE